MKFIICLGILLLGQNLSAQICDFQASGEQSKLSGVVVGQPIAGEIVLGNSLLASGLMPVLYFSSETLRDRFPPIVRLLNSSPLNAVANFSYSIAASDSQSGIARVLFHYKIGGSSGFRTDTLQKEDGAYTKGFFAGDLNEKGFCFFLEVCDNEGNVTLFPDTGQRSDWAEVLLPSGVRFSQAVGSPLQADRWQMLSLPLYPDAPDILSLLEPVLGVQDGRHWKAVYWDGTAYTRLSRDNPQSFEPGRAFFVYSRGKTIDFSTGSGKSVRVDRPFPVVMKAHAFTQVAVPFAFPVAWHDFFKNDSTRLASGIPTPLSDSYSDEGYSLLEENPILKPWRGYWIYNPSSLPCTLWVNPVSSSTAKKSLDSMQMNFSLSLRLGSDEGMVTIVGLSSLRSDVLCPPSPDGDAARIAFAGLLNEPDRITDFFFQDSAFKGRVSKPLLMEFNGRESVRLMPRLKGTLPESVMLFDTKYHTSVSVTAHEFIEISRNQNETSREFLVVFGSKDFVNDQIHTLSGEVPDSAWFAPNAPNPFNPTTRLSWGLPTSETPYHVTVEVFDIQGRLQKRLLNKDVGPGIHSLVWTGTDAKERAVSSGVYFAEIRVANSVAQFRRFFRMTLVR